MTDRQHGRTTHEDRIPIAGALFVVGMCVLLPSLHVGIEYEFESIVLTFAVLGGILVTLSIVAWVALSGHSEENNV